MSWFSKVYCNYHHKRYVKCHFPYNPTKVKLGLDKVERGWVGFWQLKGNQKIRYEAHRMYKAIHWQ